MKRVFYMILFNLSVGLTMAQSHQDCQSAFPICTKGTYHFDDMKGYGKLSENFDDVACLDANFKETNAMWLKWQAQEEGVVTFVIDPINAVDDIDFLLFKKEGDDCTDLETIRCMASGKEIGASRENSLKCTGSTGLNIQSTDEFEKQGCKFNDDNFLKYLRVEEGEIYYLLVNNSFSAKGFSISIESTSRLVDDINCLTNTLEEPVVFQSIYPNPASDYMNVEFTSKNRTHTVLELVDYNGKVLITDVIEPVVGINKTRMEVGHLTDGYYMVRIKQAEFTSTTSAIKK